MTSLPTYMPRALEVCPGEAAPIHGVGVVSADEFRGQIAEAVGGEDESGLVVPHRVQSQEGDTTFEFPADTRDPFAYAVLPPVSGRKNLKQSEVHWTPPPLRLFGLVVEPQGSTAIVESGDGRVHFLSRWDTLQGAKVLRIASGTVTYMFRNRKAEWVLEQK